MKNIIQKIRKVFTSTCKIKVGDLVDVYYQRRLWCPRVTISEIRYGLFFDSVVFYCNGQADYIEVPIWDVKLSKNGKSSKTSDN